MQIYQLSPFVVVRHEDGEATVYSPNQDPTMPMDVESNFPSYEEAIAFCNKELAKRRMVNDLFRVIRR